MDFKCAAVVTMALLAVLSSVDAKDMDVRVKYSKAQYLKNFALSVCISDGFKSDEVVKEGSAAAGAYLELGGLPLEAYEEAEGLGKKFLAKDYPSKHGQKLTLMKCIDFFHSKDLEQLVRKYSKE
jgi:hypothetical protein